MLTLFQKIKLLKCMLMLEKGRYTSVRLPIFKRCDTIEYFDKEQKSKRSANKVKRALSVFNFETPTKVSEVTTRLVVYNANRFNRVRYCNNQCKLLRGTSFNITFDRNKHTYFK